MTGWHFHPTPTKQEVAAAALDRLTETYGIHTHVWVPCRCPIRCGYVLCECGAVTDPNDPDHRAYNRGG